MHCVLSMVTHKKKKKNHKNWKFQKYIIRQSKSISEYLFRNSHDSSWIVVFGFLLYRSRDVSSLTKQTVFVHLNLKTNALFMIN